MNRQVCLIICFMRQLNHFYSLPLLMIYQFKGNNKGNSKRPYKLLSLQIDFPFCRQPLPIINLHMAEKLCKKRRADDAPLILFLRAESIPGKFNYKWWQLVHQTWYRNIVMPRHGRAPLSSPSPPDPPQTTSSTNTTQTRCSIVLDRGSRCVGSFLQDLAINTLPPVQLRIYKRLPAADWSVLGLKVIRFPTCLHAKTVVTGIVYHDSYFRQKYGLICF